MSEEEIANAVIRNAINILSITCNTRPELIIDILTGELWDEETAGDIKGRNGEFTGEFLD